MGVAWVTKRWGRAGRAAEASGPAGGTHPMLKLQRTAGNRAVTSLLSVQRDDDDGDSLGEKLIQDTPVVGTLFAAGETISEAQDGETAHPERIIRSLPAIGPLFGLGESIESARQDAASDTSDPAAQPADAAPADAAPAEAAPTEAAPTEAAPTDQPGVPNDDAPAPTASPGPVAPGVAVAPSSPDQPGTTADDGAQQASGGLGAKLAQLGRYDEALDQFKNAEHAPGSSAAAAVCAEAQMLGQLGRTAEALAAFQRYLSMDDSGEKAALRRSVAQQAVAELSANPANTP